MPNREELGWMFNGQPELSEQAQRALDLKGDLPLRLADPGLSLSVQVDDWTRPEYWWLRRGRTYRCGGVTGPVAAQVSYFTLNLTAGALPGSQVAIIDAVEICNTQASAQQYQVYTATPAVLGALVNSQQADDRQVGPPAFEVRHSSAGAPPASIASQVNFFIPAGSTYRAEGPWIISGRVMLVVAAVTVNIAHAATFLWRERALLTSER